LRTGQEETSHYSLVLPKNHQLKYKFNEQGKLQKIYSNSSISICRSDKNSRFDTNNNDFDFGKLSQKNYEVEAKIKLIMN
jgi:hypothetical protein